MLRGVVIHSHEVDPDKTILEYIRKKHDDGVSRAIFHMEKEKIWRDPIPSFRSSTERTEVVALVIGSTAGIVLQWIEVRIQLRKMVRVRRCRIIPGIVAF